MANATKVIVAARNETNEARRIMVTWEKSERMNAMSVTPAAVDRKSGVSEIDENGMRMCDWVKSSGGYDVPTG